tara:strand:- start:205 stop:381 length:177 start_codon:yes stop_codon:yes gene_type:complete
MAIVGVPDVVVLEAVHVGLELATIHVDVGDEQKDMWNIPSIPPVFERELTNTCILCET